MAFPAKMINSSDLMDQILLALDKKEPLSIISVGMTQAFIMAQYTIFSKEEILHHPEGMECNSHIEGHYHRGLRVPNEEARDAAVEAARKADIIAYNTIVHETEAKELSEEVFQIYGIKPKFIFDSFLRRVIMFSQKEKFEKMLQGRKILLIGSYAPAAKKALENRLQKKLGFEIVAALPIYDYSEIPAVKKQIENHEFDLCLLGAGINALILAPYLAEKYKIVAFDIGQAMESLITEEIIECAWLREYIGIDRAFKM